MEADWEVEIGGDAPVIEAQWPGLVDLRANPERICEIAEASAFPPLSRFAAGIEFRVVAGADIEVRRLGARTWSASLLCGPASG